MRLERLDLTPYGRFADRTLPFASSAALHVVLGANESGKTTTLWAIADLLYGFPPRTKYGFLHDQQLLRVGGALRLGDGALWEIRRRKGNKNTLTDAADRPVSDEPLRVALAGVDRETFTSEFGLTAEQLRKGGELLMMAGGKLAESLAAGSASLSGLSVLRQQLDDDAGKLFGKTRVASKPFYVALDRHDAAAKALKEAIVDKDELKSAQAALDEAKLRGLDLHERHKALTHAVNRRKRARACAPNLGSWPRSPKNSPRSPICRRCAPARSPRRARRWAPTLRSGPNSTGWRPRTPRARAPARRCRSTPRWSPRVRGSTRSTSRSAPPTSASGTCAIGSRTWKRRAGNSTKSRAGWA